MQVSVVIPTYNRASFIGEALTGVLQQTFQDFEILVIDDGSTDNTALVVKQIADARIRYMTQDHRGVSAALDLGWRAAQGEYIARLDSDDRWLPDLLQELVTRMDADPRLGAVYARAQGMDTQGQLLTQLIGTAERFPGHTLKSLIYGDSVCPTAVLIRRAAIERAGGYDSTLIANEDWDLWIRIAAQQDGIGYFPRVLAHYRYHPNNLTRTTSQRMTRVMQDRIRVLDKFFAQSNVLPEVLDVKNIAYRNVYLDWMIRSLEARDYAGAWDKFQRALALSPSRLLFLPRAAALTLHNLVLSKTTWGVRWTEAWSARRRAANKP